MFFKGFTSSRGAAIFFLFLASMFGVSARAEDGQVYSQADTVLIKSFLILNRASSKQEAVELLWHYWQHAERVRCSEYFCKMMSDPTIEQFFKRGINQFFETALYVMPIEPSARLFLDHWQWVEGLYIQKMIDTKFERGMFGEDASMKLVIEREAAELIMHRMALEEEKICGHVLGCEGVVAPARQNQETEASAGSLAAILSVKF